jgi:dTDP-4-dehydrorhamnose reductase
MTKYLVTGAHGMLGRDVVAALAGREVTGLGRADLDIADAAAVREAVDGYDVVINTAAYTRVDDAETDEDAAFAVNATGADNLAIATAETGATLAHFSSDYVFDGTASSPYPEEAPTHAVTAYGRTKAAGEAFVRQHGPARTFVIRVAYLYGQHGGNFVTTMLRLAAQRDSLSVVTDQRGQPTWTKDVAAQTLALLDSGAPAGVYHATNSGSASWFEFARAIFETRGLDPERVLPTDSAHYVQRAPRPAYSVLGHDAWARAGLAPMREWRDALREALEGGAINAP